MAVGKRESGASSEGITEEVRSRGFDRIQYSENVREYQRHPVCLGLVRLSAATVPAQVDRNHPVAILQRGDVAETAPDRPRQC